jgi:D-3-phosphoglycerate dehydrogenase
MRVLVADKLAKGVTERLESLGCAVTVDAALQDDALAAALAEVQPEVLVVRSTKVSAAHLGASASLALVIRAGAGTNTIAVDAASARGVYVANCPGKNAVAVAELTIGHLVNLDRRIADQVAALRAGRWDKKEFGKARGLHGRTLAVLGVGEIGAQVIARAQAMGMQVRAWSRSLTDAQAAALGVTRCATPLDACRGADALTVHLAFTPETDRLVGRSLLEALRPGAYVVNTSRGEVMDQDALTEAIRTRGLRAGLDVFAVEPQAAAAPFDDAIGQNPGVYGTHHIGASTDQAEEAVGDEVVRIVGSFLRKGEVPNCVNLATASAATHVLVVRHADVVGVLAGVLGVLREEGVNVQGMENIIFSGARAACARIEVSRAPSGPVLDRLRATEHIFAVSLVPLEA